MMKLGNDIIKEIIRSYTKDLELEILKEKYQK